VGAVRGALKLRIRIVFYTRPEFPHLTLETFCGLSFIGLALSYYVQTYQCWRFPLRLVCV
jgi:hypothetical protein